MAVAISVLEAQHSRLVSRRLQQEKFFGKCLMPDGSMTVLVAKAANETEASEKLHNGYKIVMVMDILTEAQMPHEWAKLRPSMTGGPRFT